MGQVGAPEVRPLLWVGDDCIDRVEQYVEERVTRCLGGWGLACRPKFYAKALSGADQIESHGESGLEWLSCPTQQGAWLAIPELAVIQAVVLRELFETVPGQSGPMTEHVSLEAARAFYDEVCALVGPVVSHITGPKMSDHALLPGHWGLLLTMELFRDIRVSLVWGAAHLKGKGWLGQAVPGTSLGAWLVQERLSTSQLRLELVVGDTDVQLGDLSSLQVGDVLVLAQQTDVPLTLKSEDESIVRPVYLGQFKGRRAAQFIPLSKK